MTSRASLHALQRQLRTVAAGGGAINLVFGLVVVWALVRYEFPGRRLFDAIVDIPFALPTAVAGIALTTLYSPRTAGSAASWRRSASRWRSRRSASSSRSIFIGLPFVVRTVQPVLEDLEAELEEAAATLGARALATIRRVDSARRSCRRC